MWLCGAEPSSSVCLEPQPFPFREYGVVISPGKSMALCNTLAMTPPCFALPILGAHGLAERGRATSHQYSQSFHQGHSRLKSLQSWCCCFSVMILDMLLNQPSFRCFF